MTASTLPRPELVAKRIFRAVIFASIVLAFVAYFLGIAN